MAERSVRRATEATGVPGTCCVCGGGEVVYRNFLDLPFCWPCADCGCGESPCVRTGVNDPAVAASSARARLWERVLAAPAWAVVLGLVAVVAGVPLTLPFAIVWLWPGIDPVILTAVNLVVGMSLGGVAGLALLQWRWDTDR